jgi:hypothetical protein
MKKLRQTEYIKISAALLLLFCFILPFSSCTERLDENGRSALLSKKPVVREVTKITYPWDNVTAGRFNDPATWIFLSCFLWPIPILTVRLRNKNKKALLVFWTFEPIATCISSCCVYFFATIFAEPAIGAHLMLSANFIYFVAWIAEAAIKISDWKKNKFNKQLQPPAFSGS